MAVQAQQHHHLAPDLRVRPRIDAELQMLQHHNNIIACMDPGDHPTSDLTCNNAASASRKRARPAEPAMFPAAKPGHVVPTSMQRVYASVGTSTSGRPAGNIASDIVSHLYNQSSEIDAIVRLQTQRLRCEIVQTREQQRRNLLSVVEQQIAKRLGEKEAELERASRRNAELEAKVREVAADSQIWFTVAKNNENVVSGLQSALEQVLAQNQGGGELGGDSFGGADFPADDAESCCFEGGANNEAAAARRENEELRRRTACRVCGEREVCVLILPCRHLCLCKECEPMLDACPVCHAMKNASLQIFLS